MTNLIPADAVASYHSEIDDTVYMHEIADSYRGHWDSVIDYVDDMITDTGMLDSMPENLRAYFDVQSFARDMQLYGDITVTTAKDGGIYVWQM